MTAGGANVASLSQRVPGMVPRTAPFDFSRFDLPHPRPFLCDLTIEQSQLSEVIPHVSNVEYVRWLDRAAELHSDSVRWTRTRLLEENIMWFVGRHEVDYLAEAWPRDRLIVATWVRDFGKTKSWRNYVIVRPSDETVICRASTLWVLVSLESRRPVRIPQSMRGAFEALEELR